VIRVITTHRNLHKSFKSRDMGRGWYWLLWSTGGVEVEGFLSESQGFTEVNHNREQGQGREC
jgi:hypothetical protein